MDHVGVIMVHDKIMELIVGVQAGAGCVRKICFCWDVDLEADGMRRMWGGVARDGGWGDRRLGRAEVLAGPVQVAEGSGCCWHIVLVHEVACNFRKSLTKRWNFYGL